MDLVQAPSDIAKDWTPPAAFPFARFEGNPRDIGLAHGRTFGDLVLGSLRAHRNAIERAGLPWETALKLAEKGRRMMRLIDQKLADELDGIADGAEIDRREIFAINNRVALTRLAQMKTPVADVLECTTAVATGAATATGHTILAQNWDQVSELQDNLVVIEQRTKGEPALLFVTEAGRLFLHGMNDAGVGIVGNALNCDVPVQPDRSFASAGQRRRALRHTSFEAAHRSMIDTLQGVPGNHLLADKSGKAVDLEAVPEAYFAVNLDGGIIAHSNHYLSPEAKEAVTDTNVKLNPGTLHREARMRAALKARTGSITVDDIIEAMRDHHGHPKGVCTHPHLNSNGVSAHTLSCTIMDLNEGRLYNAPGPTCLGTFTEHRFS